MKLRNNAKKPLETNHKKENASKELSYQNGAFTRPLAASKSNLYFLNVRQIFNRALEIPKFIVSTAFDTLFLPPTLIRECFYLLNSHFGFSKKYFWNHLCLFTMLGSHFIGLWLTVVFNEALESFGRVLFELEQDEPNYYTAVKSTIFNLIKICLFCALNKSLNNQAETQLIERISREEKKHYVKKWLNNDTHYGLEILSQASNLKNQSVNLLKDYGIYNTVITLLNKRLTLIFDLCSAYITLQLITPYFFTLNLFVFSISLPQLFVMAIAINFSYNLALSLIERPMHRYEKYNKEIADKTIGLMYHLKYNSEKIALLKGTTTVYNKITIFIKNYWLNRVIYNLLKEIKNLILEISHELDKVLPTLLCLKDIFKKNITHAKLFVIWATYHHIYDFFIWSRENFQDINQMQISRSRIRNFESLLEKWDKHKKYINANRLCSTSHSIKLDNLFIYKTPSLSKESLLYKAKAIEFKPGRRYLFSAPTGAGKTLFIKTLAGLWPYFKGEISLPLNDTLFLPSSAYLLQEGDPLLESILFPQTISSRKPYQNYLQDLRNWMETLELPQSFFQRISHTQWSEDKKNKTLTTANWMRTLSDGEQKRIALLSLLLKLKAGPIKCVIMDEPFKGTNPEIHKKMVKLLQTHIPQDCILIVTSHLPDHYGCFNAEIKINNKSLRVVH